MDGFQGMIESARGRIRECLSDRDPMAEADGILESVDRLNCLGLFSLLAFGQHGRPASSPTLPLANLTREGILKALVQIAATKGVPITQAQLHDVTNLLLSGDLCDDVASGIAVVLHTIPGLPLRLSEDIRRVPELIPVLVVGISQDLRDCPHLILEVMSDLKDGKLDSQHRIMVRTLKAFFQLGAAASVINVLRTLIGPDYETFRLAIMVYAASKGLHVEAEDLDRLRTALDPDHPDLSPLFESACRRLFTIYPEARAAQRILQSLNRHAV